MKNNKRVEKLVKWYCKFGVRPEKCTVYPLPYWSPVKIESSYIIGKKENSGEIFIFEFGFPVPMDISGIPCNELDSVLPHTCKTCEWNFWRGKGTSYCKETTEITAGACPAWELSPDAIRLAEIEYYKQLHEKHYGKVCVSL